jgi:predicted dienelactone hydrolase
MPLSFSEKNMTTGSRNLFSMLLGFAAFCHPLAYAESKSIALSPEVFALIEDPSETGSYAVSSYTSNLSAASYKSAIVYQPQGAGPFPATTLTPGFTNSKEDIAWLGQQLASHGIITIVFTPSNPYSLDTKIWAAGHVAAIETLKKENKRSNSPLAGRVDVSSLGIMGYSFGGAGAVIAANQLKDEIKAVVTLNAYRPIAPSTNVPYLFIAGNKDNVAIASTVSRVFSSMSNAAPRAFANINGLDHYGTLSKRPSKHREISRIAIAWSKVFLAEDLSYMTFIDGPESDQLVQAGSVFARPGDYVFVGAE